MADNRTNLIINYLPQTMTDQQFKAMFQKIGPLKSCKVVRHQPTNYSYGYGFADYVNEADAKSAIDNLNGLQLGNKTLKVAYARPSSEKIKNANLYVRGVPKTFTKNDVVSLFSEYGDIIQCRILVNDGEDGETCFATKGIAFILFGTNEQAEMAISKMNGHTIPGAAEPLTMKFAEETTKKVRPLPSNVTPQMQQPRFPSGPYGNFASVATASTPATMRSPGFNGAGYNQNMYGSYTGGYGASGVGGPIRTINGSQNRYQYRYNPLNGSTPTNSATTDANGQASGHIIFVYNIGAYTDEKTIWSMFAQCGTVTKVNVIRESATGIGKGYGFVSMPSYEEAVWAIDQFNGFKLNGRPLQVSFKSPK